MFPDKELSPLPDDPAEPTATVVPPGACEGTAAQTDRAIKDVATSMTCARLPGDALRNQTRNSKNGGTERPPESELDYQVAHRSR